MLTVNNVAESIQSWSLAYPKRDAEEAAKPPVNNVYSPGTCLTFMYDKFLKLALGRSSFNDLLIDCVSSYHSVHNHRTCLTNPVTTILSLQITLRILCANQQQQSSTSQWSWACRSLWGFCVQTNNKVHIHVTNKLLPVSTIMTPTTWCLRKKQVKVKA